MNHESSAYTIGHSTRKSSDLINTLSAYDITHLVDVRRFPNSHVNPQFNSEAFEEELTTNGIKYAWFERLGGRRQGFGKKSMNTCWKNKSFRNYADYMETDSFRDAAKQLVKIIDMNTVVIMCAEAVPWRCHRSLISDFLRSTSVRVTHILDAHNSVEHEFTKCAKLVAGHLTYHETSSLDAILLS
jgi:uncharacterized protein (DUF488 family)